MKFKKIAAVVSAAAVALALAGCGEGSNTSSTPNSEQSSTSSRPEESTSSSQTSESPVIDASAFEYEHDDYRNGMKITGYKLQESEVHIPETIDGEKVVGIDGNAFKDCTSITSIFIPNSVETISSSAFNGCTNLTDINIAEDNAEYLSDDGIVYSKNDDRGTFLCTCPQGKSGDIIVADGTKTFYEYAFRGCTKIVNVTLPDSIDGISSGTFIGCSNLNSVNIPDSTLRIDSSAFSNCESLTSISIPAGVTEIGMGILSGCTSLTSITVAEGNEILQVKDGMLLQDFGGTTIIAGYTLGIGGDVIVPDGVTDLGGAFARCEGLTSITIPGGVTMIGTRAFINCTKLNSVTIPDSVTMIAQDAFEECTSLTNATYRGKTYDYEHIEELYEDINSNNPYR